MISITDNASLLPHNTFGIDQTARRLVEYDSPADLASIAPIEGKFLHIGCGSNLLFTGPYEGTVLHSRIKGIEIADEDAGGATVGVRVGAAEVWDDFVASMVAQGLSGAENLSLIPGETGSAAVQNIGAYGAEARDLVTGVETVDVLTGQKRVFTNEECDYGYRKSAFKRPEMKRFVITHVNMRLSRRFEPNLSYRGLREHLEREGLSPTLENVRRAVIALRQGKLPEPSELGNAGSFFTNPVVDAGIAALLKAEYPSMPEYPAPGGKVKLSAGWLIEQAGWKGRSLGRAGVYGRQALVLVNLGGATGQEVVELANRVIHDVKQKFGVTLSPEVNIF